MMIESYIMFGNLVKIIIAVWLIGALAILTYLVYYGDKNDSKRKMEHDE